VPRQDLARIALGSIRTINGLVALFAPRTMVRRLGADPDTNGAAIYVLRMFGVRTVLLGAELFLLKGERRREALRTGVLIHASDTTAALIAGLHHQLPRKVATLVFVISSVNTGLAIVALGRKGSAEPTGAGLPSSSRMAA
jgi:hypothetical protein